MSNVLLDNVVEYLTFQKSLDKKEVFRTYIVEVMWYNRGLIADPNNPVELTRSLLSQAAELAGGSYVYDSGRARIVFN